jgi:hypothetical protein
LAYRARLHGFRIYRNKTYELSSLPDEVTVTRAGHPLKGQLLCVDRSARGRRNDGNLFIILPDGSSTLIPADWTDLHLHARAASLDTPSKSIFLDLTGLRRLVRLVDDMSVGGPQESAS